MDNKEKVMLCAKKNFEDNEWKAFDIMPRVSTDSNQKESMKDIPRLFGEIKKWLVKFNQSCSVFHFY